MTYFSFSQSVEDGLLDAASLRVQTHVLKHHDTGEQQSSGVGKTLASNIGSGTVDGLEDGALVTDVTGGSETQTTDQTGAHVRQNVTVQVGHNQDLVIVGGGVGNDLQASIVQELSVELDVGEVLGDLAGNVQEETIGHLHDGGLVHDTDLLLVDRLRILEGKAQDALRSRTGDQLDTLNNTVDNNVLDTGVFTLGVLTDQDGVDVVVGRLVAGNGSAGTDVGEKVESTAQSQVQRDVTLANRSLRFYLSSRIVNCRGITEHTARGPFSATKFFFTLAIASSGMAVLPSLRIGVTSTGSHLIGACSCLSFFVFLIRDIFFESELHLLPRKCP